MEFRVFLSSTFLDLQAEREQLVKKVFPRIRAKCRERGVEFTEIDLRWGITDEEAQSGRSVRICLDEIGRAPYFIGILGDRYGWRPGLEDFAKDEECLMQYPWLRDALGKSITEIEFMHGAFPPERKSSVLLYDRKTQQATEDQDALQALKDGVRAHSLTLRSFSSAEEFGELVYVDLAALVDRDWPQSQMQTILDRDRAAHDAYAMNRTRAYVADEGYYERFIAFVESDSAPLVVWGTSGLGKSALLAHLTDKYREQHSGAFVIRHFVGAAADATRAEDIIRHIMQEIAARYALPDELPQSDAELQSEFPSWLAKIPPEQRVVIAIDAVNQLSGIGPEMHWLPEFIPANIRVVISTTPELPLEQLRVRGYPELALKPLDDAQRERIATSFLTRYRKSLTADQLRSIVESDGRTPLFLRTLLEELRVFGQHRALGAQLSNYLACPDEQALFQRVLERMESDFGENVVRSVMTAIWASRQGLSDTELLEITQLNRLQLSEFLIALEFHLMQRGGLYTFFHQYLRSAVEARYLSTEELQEHAHLHLADYFSTREFSDRRRDEEPWQWRESGDLERLKDCMMRPEMVALFEDDRLVYEAYGYWRLLPSIPFDAAYVTRLAQSGFDKAFTSFKNILTLLLAAGLIDQALVLEQSGKTAFEPIIRESDLRELLVTRAELELNHNNYARVIELGTDLIQGQFTSRDERMLQFRALSSVAVAYYQLGRFQEGERLLRGSIDLVASSFGQQSYEFAATYKTLGALLMALGDFRASEEANRIAIGTLERLLGRSHLETVNCKQNLAVALAFQGRYDDALRDFNESLSQLQNLLGPKHKLTLQTERQIAEILARTGRTSDARTIALELDDRLRALPGSNELELSSNGIFIGFTYYLEGRFSDALPYYESNLKPLAAIRGESHPDVLRYQDRRKEILQKLVQRSAAASDS